MEIEEAKQLIASNLEEEGQFSYKILVEIQGEYLVKHNLVEAWAILRNQSPKEISSPGYVDNITLLQAKCLGLLEFVKESI